MLCMPLRVLLSAFDESSPVVTATAFYAHGPRCECEGAISVRDALKPRRDDILRVEFDVMSFWVLPARSRANAAASRPVCPAAPGPLLQGRLSEASLKGGASPKTLRTLDPRKGLCAPCDLEHHLHRIQVNYILCMLAGLRVTISICLRTSSRGVVKMGHQEGSSGMAPF